MRSFDTILESPGAFVLLMIALLLMIGQTAFFLLSIRERKNRRQLLVSSLHLLVGFLVFVILLEGYDTARYKTIPRNVVQTGWFVFSLPWLVYAFWEALSAGILLCHFLEYRHYRTGTVTSAAIRQTVDLLPEGIGIGSPDGTVRLNNLKMDVLCRELTGERLSDANLFWAFLEENGEDQEGKRLIRTPKGEVWLFGNDELAIEDAVFRRMNAINVTERYRITEDLRAKNTHLKEIRRRMKEASNLSAEMFVKQEETTARTALHNELGQVLLMGRRCIEHPDTTDRATVSLMTRQMNRILLGERRIPKPEAEDDVQQAIRMAGRIGVTVEITGDLPADDRLRVLLAGAIRECAVNTVKHAEGDRLSVEITEDAAGTRFTLTNNGMPPKGPIAESGGLLSLRREVTEHGGTMLVQSAPGFSLTMSFPRT